MPRKGKCFSSCRAKPKPDCYSPGCYYANGRKYKYCRLAFTRKMGPDCVPMARRSYKTLSHPLHNSSQTSPRRANFREKYAKKTATRKIGRFLKANRPKIRARFLRSVCSDAGVCIAFGREAKSIRAHFDQFSNFNLLSKPAERIGAVSANGFVKELTYKREAYVANAILKSSIDKEVDNLLYEAIVGFYLNRYATRFPSFLETYGLYQYKADGVAYNEAKTNKFNRPEVFSDGLALVAKSMPEINESIIKQACITPLSYAVLIQHLKEADTLRSKCQKRDFVSNDLLYILYQIYMTLSSISSVFTHYDLHDENVLVYEPVKGKYIEYHYHIDGEQIVFWSKYLAKIIDYGRCHFNIHGDTSSTGNSRNIHQLLCRAKECQPNCGYDSGFHWLYPRTGAALKQNSYINSSSNNPSHDLRLFAMLGDGLPGMDAHLQALFKKVVYGQGVLKAKSRYGTKPNTKSGLPQKINNVTDVFKALHELVTDPVEQGSNSYSYRGYEKLGELHIYNDGKTPMRWVLPTDK